MNVFYLCFCSVVYGFSGNKLSIIDASSMAIVYIPYCSFEVDRLFQSSSQSAFHEQGCRLYRRRLSQQSTRKCLQQTAIQLRKILGQPMHRADCQRIRAYYCNCPPYQSNPPTPAESQKTASFDKFISYLKRSLRFEIRLGRLQR